MRSEGKILHKDLSYKITGARFNVYNYLGDGYREVSYGDLLSKEFTKLKNNIRSIRH